MDYLQYKDIDELRRGVEASVLNLVINGLPSIHKVPNIRKRVFFIVLNLVINGLPSILNKIVEA